MTELAGGSRASHAPSLRENLGSCGVHTCSSSESSKLSWADAEGIGLQSLRELQGCIWPAGGSIAPLQFLVQPWGKLSPAVQTGKPEVWFVLTIPEASISQKKKQAREPK